MTKPLTPGCMALVVPGRIACRCMDCNLNNGKVVTLIERLPSGSLAVITPGLFAFIVDEETWQCKGDLHAPFLLGAIRLHERAMTADRLVRIDNPDGQDETLTWTPVPNGVNA